MRCDRLLAVIIGRTARIAAFGLALNAALLVPRNGHRGLMGRSIDTPRASLTVNGPLLVLGLHAPEVAIPPRGPVTTAGDVLAVRDENATVVMRDVSAAIGLAPSPDGRYLAFAGGSAGLWVSAHDGTAMHRIVEPPRTGTAAAVGVGAVAWSPDRTTLAYALNPLPSVGEPRPGPRQSGAAATETAGLWVVRTDGSGARMVVSNAGLGAGGISRLSWSSDERAIAVSATRSASGRAAPVVLLVDVASGRPRLLVEGATDGVYAPASPALAYVLPSMGAASGGTPAVSLHVVDTQTHHDRALVTGHNAISSPVWAPNGLALAYIQGPGTSSNGVMVGTDVRTVDVLGRRTDVVLTLLKAAKAGAYIRFSVLAWPRATS